MNSSLNIVEKLFLPKNGFKLFLIAIAVAYGFMPLVATIVESEARSFGLLSALTMVSVLSMWVGNRIPVVDSRFKKSSLRLYLSGKVFVWLIWLLFIGYIVVAMSTANAIPIIGAISGVDANEVSQQRGDFLKGREGAGIALLYLSAFMTTFMPYAIIYLYEKKSRLRHVGAVIFIIYAVSFMVKALFLYLIFPIMVFLAMSGKLNIKKILYTTLLCVILLIGLTFISMNGDSVDVTDAGFFTANYTPANAVMYFIWRSVGVPIFTAADTLIVHQDQFLGEPLMGATSSLIAFIAGVERVNLERYVFEYQFGSWNEVANANAVFITDAYVNFGFFGVIIFSLLVGQIFRWFCLSTDVAFKAQWINFAFMIFSASLIGALLSNWWIVMMLFGLFVRVDKSIKNEIK